MSNLTTDLVVVNNFCEREREKECLLNKQLEQLGVCVCGLKQLWTNQCGFYQKWVNLMWILNEYS